MVSDSRVIVALDYPEAGPALALAGRLDPARVRVKVGKELFTAAGPRVVAAASLSLLLLGLLALGLLTLLGWA